MCDVTCFFYEYSHESLNQLWLRPFATYVYPVWMCWSRSHLAFGTCTRRDFVSVEQRERRDVVSGVCCTTISTSFNRMHQSTFACKLVHCVGTKFDVRPRTHAQMKIDATKSTADEYTFHFVTHRIVFAAFP